MLTTLKIKAATIEQRAYKLADTGGLFVLVQPTGSKLWRYKFRINGVEGLHALGAFPEVSLAEAREAHAEVRKLVARGIHPGAARKQEKVETARAELTRTKGSFEAVVADWKEAAASGLRPATIQQRVREIDNDLMPRFKGRTISSITRLEITAALKEVEARAVEVARNLRNYLWSMFEYAIDTGLLEDNPVPPVRILRKRRQSNHPALAPTQLGKFLRQLDELTTISAQTRIAMLLVMLTACRKVEVIGARWSEFDLKKGEWEIPTSRMKGKRAHWIPLSRQASTLLLTLRSLSPTQNALLFPNRDDATRPMAGRTLNALVDRLGFGGEGSPHGMRASFSTHFNSLGESTDVIERCLAHVPANRVRAAYNRHDYKVERRAMLQAWADHIDAQRSAPSQPPPRKSTATSQAKPWRTAVAGSVRKEKVAAQAAR